jgi:hypothetical protein
MAWRPEQLGGGRIATKTAFLTERSESALDEHGFAHDMKLSTSAVGASNEIGWCAICDDVLCSV